MSAQPYSPKLGIRQTGLKLLSPLSGGYLIIPPRQIQHLRDRFFIYMPGCTRPLIPPRLAAEPRPNGIKLDIFHCQPEMPLIQCTGIEPSLPKVAAPAVKTVDILRIPKVRSADCFGQRILIESALSIVIMASSSF
jgi:hypothetical protein